MSIHLQKFRLFTTTRDVRHAGTDADVQLWFFVNSRGTTTHPTKGWNTVALDNPGDDRERGRTDLYEVDLQGGNIGASLSGTAVPRGISFANWAEVRGFPCWLRTLGGDWWGIDHYFLLGSFKELRHIPGSIDSFETVDHGWLLMSRRDGDVDMSADPGEGAQWHNVAVNGPLPG